MGNVQMVAKKAGQVLAKNSPSILTGLGVAGLITTVGMAIRATPKATALLKDEYCERVEYMCAEQGVSKKEIFLVTWKCYVPTVIMGGLTIGCIIGANSINLRRNAALAGAYTLVETSLKEYQSKVVETFGEAKAKQVKDEIAKDRVEQTSVTPSEVILTGKGETLCFDPFSARYFKSDIESVRKAINELNRDLLHDDFISLNDIYYALGLSEVKLGDYIGWRVRDGLIEPDFSSQLTKDGRPCLVMDYKTDPTYSYRDY